jgi:hypothetical protein
MGSNAPCRTGPSLASVATKAARSQDSGLLKVTDMVVALRDARLNSKGAVEASGFFPKLHR